MTAQPRWLDAFTDAYFNHKAALFALAGNVHDWMPTPQADGHVRYLALRDYLVEYLFKQRSVVVVFDRAQGIVFPRATDRADFMAALPKYKVQADQFARISRSPSRAFTLLDTYFNDLLKAGRSVALIVPYAEAVAPPPELASDDERAAHVLLADWAKNPKYRQHDFTVVLLADRAQDLNPALTQPGLGLNIGVPHPDEPPRLAYIDHYLAASPNLAATLGMTPIDLARRAEGLPLTALHELLEQARHTGKPITLDNLRTLRTGTLGAGPSTQLFVEEEDKPQWVRQFEYMYSAQTLALYILHGNIFDRIRSRKASPTKDDPGVLYRPLPDYLNQVLLRSRDIVLSFDRAGGLTFRDDSVKRDFVQYMTDFDKANKTSYTGAFPRDPAAAFSLLDGYFHQRLERDGKSIAFIIEYAETVLPMSTTAQLSVQDRAVLVQVQKWAKNSAFIRGDMSIILLTERLNDLNQQLVQTPYTFEQDIPFPAEPDRLLYIQEALRENPLLRDYLEMTPEVLAHMTAGLTIVQLNTLLAYVYRNRQPLSFELLNERKKELIEREAGGLLSFVETRFNLDAVAGQKAVKTHLKTAAAALRQGRSDVLPMGYLVNGPIGTGKTFLVSCFAADIGVPMVELKNFRSQWQGATEANLEKILKLLKAMSPVAVMIDEADATLGRRDTQGDSGVGSRVFSMIASFMSNTEHRGRILWFLLTARPDLLPVDLKRQGRAEEHLALFYPETLEEKQELLAVMLRKTGIDSLTIADFAPAFFDNLPIRSGADMEAALTRAKFLAAGRGDATVTFEHVQAAFADFVPPAYPEEVELMNLLAVLECTSRDLLPERYRDLPREEITARVAELSAGRMRR